MDKALKDLSGKFSDLLAQHQELSDDFESYKETSVQKHDALRAELDELRERVLALKSKDEAVPPTVPFFDKLKLDYPPGPDPTGVAHADKQRYKLNYPDGMLKLAGGAPDIAALYKLQLALIDYCSREGRVPYNWQVDVFDALYRRALIDAKDAMNVLTAPHDGVTWLKYLADYIDLMGPPLENALKPVKHLIISENNTLSLAVLQTALTTLLNNIADAANASSLNTRSRRDARKLTVAALAYRLPPAVRSRLYTELGMAPADDPSKTLTYSELRSFAQAALRSAWDEAGINATQRDIFAPRDGEGKAIKPKASASAKEDAEAAPAAKSTTAPAAKSTTPSTKPSGGGGGAGAGNAGAGGGSNPAAERRLKAKGAKGAGGSSSSCPNCGAEHRLATCPKPCKNYLASPEKCQWGRRCFLGPVVADTHGDARPASTGTKTA